MITKTKTATKITDIFIGHIKPFEIIKNKEKIMDLNAIFQKQIELNQRINPNQEKMVYEF